MTGFMPAQSAVLMPLLQGGQSWFLLLAQAGLNAVLNPQRLGVAVLRRNVSVLIHLPYLVRVAWPIREQSATSLRTGRFVFQARRPEPLGLTSRDDSRTPIRARSPWAAASFATA